MLTHASVPHSRSHARGLRQAQRGISIFMRLECELYRELRRRLGATSFSSAKLQCRSAIDSIGRSSCTLYWRHQHEDIIPGDVRY